MADSWIDLYWLPLGACGWFVRRNGRLYEWLVSRREHRAPLELYHAGLVIGQDGVEYAVEMGPVWNVGTGRARGGGGVELQLARRLGACHRGRRLAHPGDTRRRARTRMGCGTRVGRSIGRHSLKIPMTLPAGSRNIANVPAPGIVISFMTTSPPSSTAWSRLAWRSSVET